jgi:hypothetical protein
VQRVEERDEVVALAGILGRGCDLERDATGEAFLLGGPPGGLDRSFVIVEPDELGRRIRARHEERRPPWQQPTSATLAPAWSFATTPSSKGSQDSTRESTTGSRMGSGMGAEIRAGLATPSRRYGFWPIGRPTSCHLRMNEMRE